jgi:hypothetical protein
LNIDQAAEISGLSRFEYSEKSKLLTPNQIESNKTSNNHNVDNFLRFPMHPYTIYLVKLNQSYRNMKTVRKRMFKQKAGNRFDVGAR